MHYDKFQQRPWAQKRWTFNVGTALVMIHCIVSLAPLVGMYYSQKAGHSAWSLAWWTALFLVNLYLCVRAQWYMRFWEAMLDAYEKRHGLNTDYHKFVDDMKRQGKWPRPY